VRTQRAPRAARSLVAVAVAGSLCVVAASCSLIHGSSASHEESVFDLEVGQCLVPPKKVQAEITSIEVVPCTKPHPQQVYALVKDNAGSTYPTSTALDKFANGSCLDRFAGYVGIAYEESKLYFTYLLPSVRSWADGDRTVVCVAESVTKPLTRSIKGSKL